MNRLRFLLTALCMLVAFAGCGSIGQPHGVTVEEFYEMGEWQRFLLMGCQINKYKEQVGDQEAMEWVRQQDKEAMKQDVEDIRPLAVDFIKEKGVSCTRAEIDEWKKERGE